MLVSPVIQTSGTDAHSEVELGLVADPGPRKQPQVPAHGVLLRVQEERPPHGPLLLLLQTVQLHLRHEVCVPC